MPRESNQAQAASDRSSHRQERRHRSPSRSRSPRRTHHTHTGSHRHRYNKKRSHSPQTTEEVPPARPVILPFRSSPLSKHDLRKYKSMFASYLDIQKQIDIDDLSEDEVKGRWKAFVGKWNRGELAEGWYDPQTLVKAIESAQSDLIAQSPSRYNRKQGHMDADEAGEAPGAEEDDDDWGPTLPAPSVSTLSSNNKSKSGPTIPTTSDLALRDDLRQDDLAADQDSAYLARKAERKLQQDRLDELAPRAEAGTRERQLEKKREAAASNRAFAEARGGGGGGGAAMAEVGESELMGAADGGVEEVKRMKANMERKKNEREIRREEVLRARALEREERLAGLKEREEKTMSMLRAIAKERFG